MEPGSALSGPQILGVFQSSSSSKVARETSTGLRANSTLANTSQFSSICFHYENHRTPKTIWAREKNVIHNHIHLLQLFLSLWFLSSWKKWRPVSRLVIKYTYHVDLPLWIYSHFSIKSSWSLLWPGNIPCYVFFWNFFFHMISIFSFLNMFLG